MENINISVGLELDKSQFNEKYVQGAIDDSVKNASIKIDNIKLGDVSKKIPNELTKQASRLKIQIKDVDINSKEIDDFIKKAEQVSKSFNEKLSNNIKITGDLDLKNVEAQIKNDLKYLTEDLSKSLGIDGSKISITGIRGAARDFIETFQSEIKSFAISPKVGSIDLGIIDNLDDELISKIKKSFNSDVAEEFKSLGKELGILFSADFIREAVAIVKKGDLKKFNNAILDEFERVKGDYDFNELEKISNGASEAGRNIKILTDQSKALSGQLRDDTIVIKGLIGRIDEIKNASIKIDTAETIADVKKVDNEVKKLKDSAKDVGIVSVDPDSENKIKAIRENVSSLFDEIEKASSEMNNMLNKGFNDGSKKSLDEYGKIIVKGENLISSLADGGVDFPDEEITKLNEKLGDCFVLLAQVSDAHHEYLKNVQSETSKVEVPVSIASEDIVDEIEDVEQEIEKVAKNSNFEMPIDIVTSEPTETIISGIEDMVENVEDSGEFNIELDVFISEESKIRIQKQLEELSEGLSLTVKNLNFNEEIKKTEGFSSKDVELNINTKDLTEKIQEIKTKFNALIDELNSVEPVNVDIDVVITKETRDSINGQLDALSDILELNIEHINISTDTIKNMIESLSKEISDGLNIDLGKSKIKGNLSGKNIDLEALTENIANETTEELNKVESKVDSISKTVNEISPVGIVDDIRNEEALLDRLEQIKATATEISRISYGTDRNGMLKATIKYVNELGQSISEVWGYDVETGIFGKLSESGVEQFVNINKEVSKMQETLNKVKGNDLVDAKRIKEAEDSLKSLQENVNRLDTKEATRQVELLANEIDSMSLVDRFMTRFDNAFDIRESMGIATKGLEGLRGRIQEINVDTPIKNIRLISREIQRLGSGNSIFIGLQAVIDKATKSLENFGNAKDKLAFEKLNSDINKANKLIKKIGEGAVVSATEVRVLRESVRDVYNELKALEDKKVKLNLRLDNLYDSGTIGKRVLNNVKKQVESMTTANVATMFNTLSKSIDSLDNREKAIKQINDALKDTKVKLEELKFKNGTLFEEGKLKKEQSAISKIEEQLIDIVSTLKKSTDDVDLAMVDKALEKLDSAKGKLEKQIDYQKQLNTLTQKQMQLRNALGELDGKIKPVEILKVKDAIDKMKVDTLNEDFKRINDMINKFGKSETQIFKVDKTINKLKSDLNSIKESSGFILDNEKVAKEVADLENYIEKLTKTREELNGGLRVSPNILTDLIDKSNNSYNTLNATIAKVLANKEKVDKLERKISESTSARQTLGEDVAALERKKENLKEIDLTSQNVKKTIEVFANEINKLGQSDNQIVRLNKTISDYVSNLNNLEGKSKSAWNNLELIDEFIKLTDYIDKLTDAQNKLLNGEGVNGSVITDTINKLTAGYNELNSKVSQISSNESKLEDIGKKIESSLDTRRYLNADLGYLNKLVREFESIDVAAEGAADKVFKLSEKVDNLDMADGQIRKVQDVIGKLNDKIKDIEDSRGVFDLISEDDALRISNMRTEIAKLEGVLKDIENGAEYTKDKLQRMIDVASSSGKSISKLSNETSNIFSGLGSAINQGMQTALGFEFLDIFTDQLMQMKDAIVELDNEMVGLKRVSTASAEEYDRISKAANQTAIEMGKTTQETLNATTAFVKMGYSVSEASDYLSKAGLMLSNVAEMDIDSAVNAIVSTMKGMNYPAEEAAQRASEIVDVINEAGNKFALNSEDLAEGLRIGAASLKIAGNDLYESSALITAGTEVLQDSKQVANGLRTISMRLRGLSEDEEELNPKLEEMIKTMTGVDLTDTNGQFRSTYDILLDISKVWDTLDTKQQALLLENIAGKTQV